mmetsp:Transcript_7085/g.21168  ORF Transcript_7085/g.21168 Transcript_7085/m.21168 type:complete len:93 (+) Transcript_7085:586-864(+)
MRKWASFMDRFRRSLESTSSLSLIALATNNTQCVTTEIWKMSTSVLGLGVSVLAACSLLASASVCQNGRQKYQPADVLMSSFVFRERARCTY